METTAFANPKTGFTLETLTPRHFSFNSYLGACDECQGLGMQRIIDPELIIVDASPKLSEIANRLRREGFVRMRIEGEIHDLEGEFTILLPPFSSQLTGI